MESLGSLCKKEEGMCFDVGILKCESTKFEKRIIIHHYPRASFVIFRFSLNVLQPTNESSIVKSRSKQRLNYFFTKEHVLSVINPFDWLHAVPLPRIFTLGEEY
jgi:hypothetical protein